MWPTRQRVALFVTPMGAGAASRAITPLQVISLRNIISDGLSWIPLAATAQNPTSRRNADPFQGISPIRFPGYFKLFSPKFLLDPADAALALVDQRQQTARGFRRKFPSLYSV